MARGQASFQAVWLRERVRDPWNRFGIRLRSLLLNDCLGNRQKASFQPNSPAELEALDLYGFLKLDRRNCVLLGSWPTFKPSTGCSGNA